jgi:dinuclear metal center YbgI/SA1388 family protein
VSTLGEFVAALERAYPPALAEDWDAVGLVCGDPADRVDRVLVCVDPADAVVDAAIEAGAGLLVAHHPLLLRGVHGVPANTPKGNVVHRLVRAGIGLYTAHTNADAAVPGVSDALAAVLGVAVEGPLRPDGQGEGTGIGRVGVLPDGPVTLAAFAERAAAALPDTAWGVRVAGDPDRLVRRVAVCGGAGDSLLDDALAAGVDVYLTADLRHHTASEHLARPGAPALIDAAHWATEQPWCAQAVAVLAAVSDTVDVLVSTQRTDPWTVGVRPAGGDRT